MKEQEIKTLMERCLVFFEQNCYSQHRINVYKRLWRNGIIRFMEANGLTKYKQSVGAMFVETCHYNGTVRPQEREKIRFLISEENSQYWRHAFLPKLLWQYIKHLHFHWTRNPFPSLRGLVQRSPARESKQVDKET